MQIDFANLMPADYFECVVLSKETLLNRIYTKIFMLVLARLIMPYLCRRVSAGPMQKTMNVPLGILTTVARALRTALYAYTFTS